MNSKPLTYDSLKTVIQYMEPNTRILLYSKIPLIRTVERRVPLRLKELVVGNHHIRVNDISYSYEVYQMNDTKNVVSGRSRLNGRTVCDVDEFGIRDYITKAGGMVPGNNGHVERNLFGDYDRENIPSNEGRLERLKKLLEVEKQQYSQLLNYRPNGNVNGGHRSFYQFTRLREDTIGRIYKQEELELLENEENVKKVVESTKERIKRMKKELVPFENKRNNIRPNFEIHFMKSRGNKPLHLIKRINYTRDLHKAGEYLMEVMFGKRRDFQTNLSRFYLGCTTQYPRSFKIKANKLCFIGDGPLNLDRLKPVIDESSFPLEEISIQKPFHNPQEIEHELIGNCKALKLSGKCDLLLRLIPTLQHQSVDFFIPSYYFEREPFITLIRSWIETNNPVGTCFTFSTYQSKQHAIEVLHFVNNQINGSVLFFDRVDIPMANSKVVRISYESDKQDSYLIKMTVVSL
uniref:Methyltransf_14 domain-containing protein n=1 Tax=Caenorhabditis tropicalis TaxID=1561998 RepID=A0A1I7TAH1_9PELO